MLIKSSLLRYFRVRHANLYRIMMLLICIVVVVLILPKEKRFKYEFEKGKVWMHPDLISPFNFAIEKTKDELEQDKKDAINSVLPVYKIDPRIAPTQIEAFKIDFDMKWKSRFPGSSDRAENFKTAVDFLEHFYERGIINLNNRYRTKNTNDYNITLVQNNVGTNMNTASVYTPTKALDYVK